MAAQRTLVGGALATEAEDLRGVEGIALGTVAAFARAGVFALFGGRAFHGSGEGFAA